ncbi:antirepressor [Listeria fleischmannii FSL S10-1203]|uniref:Antirepressor n=1 Tax=Listeria fleischmannii FSL S10-1203 TaxID=1265822 RepID=W7DAV3_9LIST|nr:antirepressor [Listeria fleischmannii FSL S10-1203]
MNQLQKFTFEGTNVRTIIVNEEPYFVGKDVAEVLGYQKPRNALTTHVDGDDKKDAPIQGDLGGTQTMTIINESGLYSLILKSKLPTAKKIQTLGNVGSITKYSKKWHVCNRRIIR